MSQAAACSEQAFVNSKHTPDHASAQHVPETKCQVAAFELVGHLSQCRVQLNSIFMQSRGKNRK